MSLQNVLAGLADQPSLAAWLRTDEWQDGFETKTIERASEYSNAKLITSLQWHPLPSEGEWAITPEVQGTTRKPYKAAIHFRDTGIA